MYKDAILYICECDDGNEYESFMQFDDGAEYEKQIIALKALTDMSEDDLKKEQEDYTDLWQTVCGYAKYADECYNYVIKIRFKTGKFMQTEV